MPQPHNFDPTNAPLGKRRGQNLLREYADQQTYGVLIALIALSFIFAVSWWGEVLR
jgi:hypothetical protein